MRRWLSTLMFVFLLNHPVSAQTPLRDFCDDECRFHVFTGMWVNDSMTDIFVHDLIPPTDWDYRSDERIYGFAVSKKVASFFNDTFEIEPEVGVSIRTGEENTQEVWAAIYLRYDGFPWNERLYTSIGISTGLNYAFDVTDLERQRAGDSSTGSRLLHYLAPEIAFALPRYPEREIVFRFHHRSGGYGLINDTDGGAHYGTVGLRFRF